MTGSDIGWAANPNLRYLFISEYFSPYDRVCHTSGVILIA